MKLFKKKVNKNEQKNNNFNNLSLAEIVNLTLILEDRNNKETLKDIYKDIYKENRKKAKKILKLSYKDYCTILESLKLILKCICICPKSVLDEENVEIIKELYTDYKEVINELMEIKTIFELLLDINNKKLKNSDLNNNLKK